MGKELDRDIYQQVEETGGNMGSPTDPKAIDTVGTQAAEDGSAVRIVFGHGEDVIGTLALATPKMRGFAADVISACELADSIKLNQPGN